MGDDNFVIQALSKESIPSNKVKIGSASMLLNQLPALIGTKELSGAYKVILPSGIVGNLMKMHNGLYTTSVIGESGKIVAQAGLTSLSSVATPLAVFSVASIITGQYFMSQINQSLNLLANNVEEIQKQVDTTEEAVVFTASIFLNELKNDWPILLESDSLKAVYTTSILKTINDLTSSCYYFENRLNIKMNELKDACRSRKPLKDNLFQELERNYEFLRLSYEIRSCLKLILIYLSSGINQDNSTSIKQVLEADDKLIFSSTIAQLDERIDDVIELLKKVPTEKQQAQVREYSKLIKEVRSITREQYNDAIRINMINTIDRIANLDSEGKTFYIEDGQIYIAA